jgi:hypothetical protein
MVESVYKIVPPPLYYSLQLPLNPSYIFRVRAAIQPYQADSIVVETLALYGYNQYTTIFKELGRKWGLLK